MLVFLLRGSVQAAQFDRHRRLLAAEWELEVFLSYLGSWSQPGIQQSMETGVTVCVVRSPRGLVVLQSFDGSLWSWFLSCILGRVRQSICFTYLVSLESRVIHKAEEFLYGDFTCSGRSEENPNVKSILSLRSLFLSSALFHTWLDVFWWVLCPLRE